MNDIIFYGFYIFAFAVLFLHFTGRLRQYNMEWLVLVVAVAIFPVVWFFK